MARAVVIEQYGGPEVLQMKEVRVDAPGPNQVRLQHTRIGVNFHDWPFSDVRPPQAPSRATSLALSTSRRGVGPFQRDIWFEV